VSIVIGNKKKIQKIVGSALWRTYSQYYLFTGLVGLSKCDIASLRHSTGKPIAIRKKTKKS
jgi:hypothetical protein